MSWRGVLQKLEGGGQRRRGVAWQFEPRDSTPRRAGGSRGGSNIPVQSPSLNRAAWQGSEWPGRPAGNCKPPPRDLVESPSLVGRGGKARGPHSNEPRSVSHLPWRSKNAGQAPPEACFASALYPLLRSPSPFVDSFMIPFPQCSAPKLSVGLFGFEITVADILPRRHPPPPLSTHSDTSWSMTVYIPTY